VGLTAADGCGRPGHRLAARRPPRRCGPLGGRERFRKFPFHNYLRCR
jgi:hypothetical protein